MRKHLLRKSKTCIRGAFCFFLDKFKRQGVFKKMTKSVKIRKIEMDIYNVLKMGYETTSEVADQLGLSYSSIHSLINRMVMYDIVTRKRTGRYSPLEGNFMVASDTEVIAFRRGRKERLKSAETSNVMSVPAEVIEFIRRQYNSDVDRNTILLRLRNNGVHMSKYNLNRIIYTYSIDRKYPQRNQAIELEYIR